MSRSASLGRSPDRVPVTPDEFIAEVTRWSQRDERVLAAALCGSYARGEARPDSDVDVCLLTADRDALLNERAWIFDFGAHARVEEAVEDYGLVQSARVFYGALEVEFGVTHEAWAALPIDRETAAVINDGLRVLYDPEERLKKAIEYSAAMPG